MSLFIWGTLTQCIDLSSKKHATSYGAIEKKATEVKREYGFTSRGFCAHVHGKWGWRRAVNGTEIYWGVKWRTSSHGLLSRSTSSLLISVRESKEEKKNHEAQRKQTKNRRCQVWICAVLWILPSVEAWIHNPAAVSYTSAALPALI